MSGANNVVVQNGTCGKNLTWKLDESGILTISGTGDMDNYDFFLARPWSGVRKSITSVIIGYGVTSIGSYAFCGCESLVSITIPDSVIDVGGGAFEDCSSLQYNSYDHAKYLGNENNPFLVLAGASSTNITNCDIHPDTKVICGSAFYDCSDLASITIPDGVTSIGSAAFLNCSHLTGVIIPESVTSIDAWAFCGCSSVTRIAIPDGVTSIGEGTFEDCGSLTSISVPDSVTNIGSKAFKNCSSLLYNVYDHAKYLGNENNPYFALVGASSTNITNCDIHPDTKVICGSAFYNCSSLAGITIPSGVATIGEETFCGCRSLTSIVIPDGVINIGSVAFRYCQNLKSVVLSESLQYIGDCAFLECKQLETLRLPNSLLSIGNGAFQTCRMLSEVQMPSRLTKLGAEAFNGCCSLNQVRVPDGITKLSSGVFAGCKKLKDVTLPDGLKEMGRACFGGCESLTEIQVPNTVTIIDERAFSGCERLRDIQIPNNVTTIGDYAFARCTSLTTVTLPPALGSIGEKAFADCDSGLLLFCGDKIFGMLCKETKDAVTKLWLMGKAQFGKDQESVIKKYVNRVKTRLFTEIEGDDDEALAKLLSCSKPKPEIIESYLKKCNDGQHPKMMAMLLSYKDKNVSPQVREELIDKELGLVERTAKDWAKIYRWNAEEGGITITKYKGIDEDVDIPDQIDGLPVVKIGKNAFKGNTQLSKVRIPNTVTEIMESAFEKCTTLLNVEWSENLTHIEKRAFYWCSMLSGTLSLPQSVKSLGVSAFARCDFSKFDLPEGLEYIERGALACGDIQELHIPATVKKMADCIEYSTGDLYIHGMKTKIPVNYFQGMPLTVHAYAGSYAAKCAEKGAFETFVLIEDRL